VGIQWRDGHEDAAQFGGKMAPMIIRTQVGIVGAGPAGLLLSHLLHLHGIESIILENRSRHYVEHRIRAGVLEHGSVKLLVDAGVGDRLLAEGMEHRGIQLRFNGRRHLLDFKALVGRTITIYGQQEVVKDLIAARLKEGGEILFEVSGVSLEGLAGGAPTIRFVHGGKEIELRCEIVAGCDGFHGVCRASIPTGSFKVFEREYPFAWLGILAQAAPASDELIYSYDARGFALFSMRSPRITRLYLQVRPDEDLANWPDDRIWDELQARLRCDDGWRLNEGPVLEKSLTTMRSYVIEPMQYGSLFLAGDAAHIVPPTGAKGMNLALADVYVLAEALAQHFKLKRNEALESYSSRCLRRVWRAEHFSWWMTSMLHRFADDAFQHRLQLAQLEYVVSSRSAAASLAENYTGFPLEQTALSG
jgi:p-hydroxybenzoate 3-monooxygenase